MEVSNDVVNAITSADFNSILTTIQEQISVSTIVEVLGVAVGASVGFVFMWWGIRKLVRVIMGAVKSGKLRP